MFTITIHYLMSDTVVLRADNPLIALATVNMARVNDVQITSNLGD